MSVDVVTAVKDLAARVYPSVCPVLDESVVGSGISAPTLSGSVMEKVVLTAGPVL